MAVKAMLASLDGVPEALKGEYKQGDGGRWYLDLEGVDDHPSVGALRRAKEHEVTARKGAEDAAKQVKEKLLTVENELNERLKGAVPAGDVKRLEDSYKQKLADREKELGSANEVLTNNLKTILVDNKAQELAAAIAVDPKLIPVLLPHIKARLATEIADGKASTRILDKDGKPSASTLDDLRKEFIDNPSFAPLIVGSKASGGGAAGGSGGSGASQKKVDYATAPAKDIVADIKAKKELAQQQGG